MNNKTTKFFLSVIVLNFVMLVCPTGTAAQNPPRLDPQNEQRAFQYANSSHYMKLDKHKKYWGWLAPLKPARRMAELREKCSQRMGVSLLDRGYHQDYFNSVKPGRYVNAERDIILIPNLGAPDYLALFKKTDKDLSKTLRMVDVFGFHGGSLSSGHLFGNGDAHLCSFANERAFQRLRKLNKGIGVEYGVLKKTWNCSPAFGAMAAVSSIEDIRLSSGETPDFIYLDEPLKEGCRDTLLATGKEASMAVKADAIAEYYKYMKLRYPSIKYGLIEWYPGKKEGYPSFSCDAQVRPDCGDGAGDIIKWIKLLLERGVKLHAFHLDTARGHPNYSEEKYKRDLRRLEVFLSARGIRFGPIYWSAAKTQTRYADVIRSKYKEVARVLPDEKVSDFIFQSWSPWEKFSIPFLLPETGTEISQIELLEEIVSQSSHVRAVGSYRYDHHLNLVKGWGCYKQVRERPPIVISAVSPEGSGVENVLHRTKTNLPSEARVKEICGLNRPLRFQYRLLASDIGRNNNRSLVVKIPVRGGSTKKLKGSGKIMNLRSRVKGFVNYDARTHEVKGWGCFHHVNYQPSVAIFAGGKAGSPKAVKLNTQRVNLQSGQGVIKACGLPGKFRFRYKLTRAQIQRHRGKPIHVHVPLPYERGAPLLTNSGKITVQ